MARAEIDDNNQMQLLNHLNAAGEEVNAIVEELNAVEEELNATREELNTALGESNKLKAAESTFIDEIKEFTRLHPMGYKDNNYSDYSLIITALKCQYIDLVKYLMDEGYRVYKDFKSVNETTILHVAIKLNDADLIKNLLVKGAFPDILALNEQSKTPFHLAIDRNQLSTIQLFLTHFDAKWFDEKYLLHYAVEKANIQVVHLLIQHGLSLTKKNEKKLTPYCIALKADDLEILDCLLSHYQVQNIKPNDHDDIAPAYIAIIRGNLKVIKKYANSDLSINMPLKFDTNTWPCLCDYTGFTLLHFAVTHIKLEIVRFLLRKGVDILVKNKSGSALHIAFETKGTGIWKTWQDFNDNNTIIDLILKTHLKFNSNLVNKNGLSHFHVACSTDDPTVVEHFLKVGAPINQPVKLQCPFYKKFSPLHFAAKFRCKETMEVLLKNGADVKQRDFEKMTALHIAAKESCLETVSLLLQYGADVASVDSHGKTPVHWAFENKSYKIIDLLLSVTNVANSNPMNSEGVSHFHIACTRNNANVIKSFIENGVNLDLCIPAQSDKDNHSEVTNWSGYSSLHLAVSNNRAKIVQLLLSSGANVGIKSSTGLTPLHSACQYTSEMFAEFIENTLRNLSKHRKITQQMQPITDVVSIDEKRTSQFSGSIEKLDWSSHRKDYLKIINSLLEHESDVNSIDNSGNTPISYAYDSVMQARIMLESSLDCSKDLFDQIVKSLSTELYGRRKLILNHLVNLDANLDKCFQHSSIFNCIARNRSGDFEWEEMTKWFLSKGANIDARNNRMLTPLLQAITDGKYKFIYKLLEYGASVDCIDPRDNSTPLALAVCRSQQPVIGALVIKGINLYARRSDGLTALHLACKMSNVYALNVFLRYCSNINVEDNAGRSVCCYFYERHLKSGSISFDASWMMKILQLHIIKMSAAGLRMSEKVLSSSTKFDQLRPLDEEEKKKWIENCETEVRLLRGLKINDNYTVYDVIFEDENSLSQLVKNPAFKAIVECKSFKKKYMNYGYLIKLKYETGAARGNLLPKAKILINQLAGVRLPEICSENICKYFNNSELKESLKILSGIVNSDVNFFGDVQSISHKRHKRQRVD